jgi:nucleotidyltransferase substrate binding protein (TIGR01987 family)
MTDKPRWKYRFDNFSRAFSLLREAIETAQSRALTQLEKEGVIQRFEYTWELSWKLLKDYIEKEGIALEMITPSMVIKTAFAAKIIEDGETWMKALDARNKMSHTYDLKVFEKIISEITTQYLSAFDGLYIKLLKEYHE